MLLKFQRQNLVETSSSSSDSDDNRFDHLRLLGSHNPLVKLTAHGKMKKMVYGF